MATYEEIHGKRVEVFDSDPTIDSTYEGQVWYNSATGALRTVVSFASWVAAPNMSQARRAVGGFGVQTAAVMVGGDNGAGTFFYRNVEEYNGTGFSAGTNIPEMGAPTPPNYLGLTDVGQAGTETAGVIFGGESYTRPGNMTAEYDGSAWTITGNMNNLRRGTGCGGTQTAAFACGGYDGSNRAYTEHYNGSSWTNSNAMNTAMMCANGRANLAPQTAGLVFGGSVVPGNTTRTTTEEYNGSTWAAGGALNNATLNASGGGTQTAGLKFGGGPPETSAIASTENYDGSSWTTGTNMGTLRTGCGGVGSQTAAFAAGGKTSTTQNVAEEYNLSINTFTAASWASGGNYPTNIYGAAGAGNTPAGLAFGGYNGSGGVTTTSEYDGSTWTGGGALPVAKRYLTGFGTQTAALGAKGRVPTGSPSEVNTSEEYDGSSWTSGGTASVAASMLSGSGTQTSGLVFGGTTPPYTNSTEEYNGSSWTTGGNLGTAKANLSGSIGGTQTAALAFFGDDGSTPLPTNTEAYDGTSWSEQSNVPAGRFAGGGAGTQTNAYGFGGYTSPGVPNQTTSTINYNGTSWASQPSMATARGYNSGSAGTAPAGIFTIGDFPVANSTEEFIGRTETVTAKTLTTG